MRSVRFRTWRSRLVRSASTKTVSRFTIQSLRSFRTVNLCRWLWPGAKANKPDNAGCGGGAFLAAPAIIRRLIAMDSGQQFLQQLINALSLGTIYSLFALGYALVFSVLGVLNLAHSAIFTAGAVIGLLLMR